MKNYFILSLLCFLMALSNLKADELPTTSKVTDVTVYLNMARETRIATFNAPKGSYEVILNDISEAMVDNSLQVGVKGPATLLSASVRTNYFNEPSEIKLDPKILKLQDSLKFYTSEIQWVEEQKKVIKGEIALVEANNKLGSQHEAMKPSDLIALADFYRNRISDLRKRDLGLIRKTTEYNEKVQKIQSQINELGSKPKEPRKEIILSFSSEITGNVSLNFNYLVTQAGWRPMYDLKVVNTSQPVNLDYKAGIYQNTGFDWKDVKISVSTANPNRNNERPILNPRFVDYLVYRAKAAPSQPSRDAGTTTFNMMQSYDNSLGAELNLEPIILIADNGMSVEFTIDIKQKIKSDSKEHVCKIQSYKIPATYKYHAVPKLDLGAFLLARITDYGQYNLLPGKSNIFFDDMYIGQTTINPQSIGDTLLVSLGRDENISIKRTKLMDKTSKKFLSDSQKETYGWEIAVRNNKASVLEIEILDQIPISKQENIKVDLIEKSGANYTKEYGKLLWNLKIQPNSAKTLKLEYSIEYPKDKTIHEF
jgi:uncharacterized protein (TIGR02231 family)